MEIWAFHSINGEILSKSGEMGASHACVMSLRTVCLTYVSLIFLFCVILWIHSCSSLGRMYPARTSSNSSLVSNTLLLVLGNGLWCGRSWAICGVRKHGSLGVGCTEGYFRPLFNLKVPLPSTSLSVNVFSHLSVWIVRSSKRYLLLPKTTGLNFPVF